MRQASTGVLRAKKVATGPLARVPVGSMRRARTLEARMPAFFAAAFVGLIVIQAWLALQ